jgi:hypothetical protein
MDVAYIAPQRGAKGGVRPSIHGVSASDGTGSPQSSERREDPGEGAMEQERQTAEGDMELGVRRLELERKRAERAARDLSNEAVNQWQKAVEGALAFPAACALGTAACTMYFASYVSRAFEILRVSARTIQRDLAQEMRDRRELGREEAMNQDPRSRRENRDRHHGDAAQA